MNTSVFGQNPGFPSFIHTAPPDISAYDAARLMGWRNVGVIVVVRDHQPVGILTDRDLATRVLGNGLDARSVRIGRAMSQPIVSMKEDQSDEQILQHMVKSRVRQIPLVDGAGLLIGLAAVEASGDGKMTVGRSTVLVPMVKRKRWGRLVFRLKQETISNLRWIGATVVLAAIAGLVSLVAVGYWNPWEVRARSAPASLSSSRAAVERSGDSLTSKVPEPVPPRASTK